ncbi:MAG: 2,5-diamino-6-(ribosylamino)-4(3H)-pyrimidinone 5'-phosphate reductase [Halobacteriota archaeon]
MMNRKKHRPFVFINLAMSADGKVSTVKRKQVRISGDNDLDRVDSLRAGCDAIMVGIGTVLADDPSLTVKSEKRRAERREAGKAANPMRVVVDSKARTSVDAEILNKGEGEHVIAVSERAIVEDVDRLGDKAEIWVCGIEEVDLKKLLYLLWQRGVNRLMVEGGATLNWSLLSQKLVDEIYIYVGNILLGGEDAPTPVGGSGFVRAIPKLELFSTERLDQGVLLQWRLRNMNGDEI